VTIAIVGDTTPSVPVDFQRRLSAFDPDLYVSWHKSPADKKPGRWKIERCTRHYGAGRSESGRKLHDHTCVRVYILMCQDDEGTPKPLGDWVFEKLREMRQRWEALGGDSEHGVRNAIAESDRIEREQVDKREAASQDMISHNQKDKRVQINRLFNLIERHDMRPNR
jgi:hypothetical protein